MDQVRENQNQSERSVSRMRHHQTQNMLVEGTWLIGNSLRVERVGDRTIVMTSGIVVFHDWLIQMMRAEREDRKEGFDLDLNPYK